jgi:hypothetical protein
MIHLYLSFGISTLCKRFSTVRSQQQSVKTAHSRFKKARWSNAIAAWKPMEGETFDGSNTCLTVTRDVYDDHSFAPWVRAIGLKLFPRSPWRVSPLYNVDTTPER